MRKNLTTEQIKSQLKALAKKLKVEKVANVLFDNFKFWEWSGSCKDTNEKVGRKHHYGKGGLALHTYEVVMLCMKTAAFYGEIYNIDPRELFLAALFHDSGKMFDYEFSHDANGLVWTGTPHKRMIHHISRSGIIWSDASKADPEIHEKYHDLVLHAILAHHGNRDFGSPVAPKTRVALMVHLCDGISARMYDADTRDEVEELKKN